MFGIAIAALATVAAAFPAGAVRASEVRQVAPLAGTAGYYPAVPAGFQPGQASFLSAERGFVLGAVNCQPGHICATSLVATTDGGAHWRLLATPPRRAENILFAGRRIGWLYGNGLWETTDGAAHWHQVAIRGRVLAMAVSARVAYAVVTPPRGFSNELFRSPVGHGTWTRVPAVTAGPEPSLAVSGRSAWFGSGGQVWTTSDGAHWHLRAFACTGASYVLTDIAAASPTRVDFLCTSTADFNTASEGMEVMASANGGKTVHLAGRKAPIIGDGGVIAMPPGRPGIITFATSVGIPSWIGRSADGGRSWRRVALFRNGPWSSLAYVSKTVGWIVLGAPGLSRTSELLRTTDAGRTWRSAGP